MSGLTVLPSMTTITRIASPQARFRHHQSASIRNYNETGAAWSSAALETPNKDGRCGREGKKRRTRAYGTEEPHSLHSTGLIHLTSFWQASWLYPHGPRPAPLTRTGGGAGTRPRLGGVVYVPSARMSPDPGPHWPSWMPLRARLVTHAAAAVRGPASLSSACATDSDSSTTTCARAGGGPSTPAHNHVGAAR